MFTYAGQVLGELQTFTFRLSIAKLDDFPFCRTAAALITSPDQPSIIVIWLGVTIAAPPFLHPIK